MSLRLLPFRALALFCLGFVLVYTAIFGGLLLSNDGYCSLLRPLFALQTRIVAPGGSEISLKCASPKRLDPMLVYNVGMPRSMPGGGTGIRRYQGAVKLLPLAQNAAVLGALALAWPVCGWRRRLLALLAGEALLHLVFVLDAPMVYLADDLPPASLLDRVLQWWSAFSSHGGRLVLLFSSYAATVWLLMRKNR